MCMSCIISSIFLNNLQIIVLECIFHVHFFHNTTSSLYSLSSLLTIPLTLFSSHHSLHTISLTHHFSHTPFLSHTIPFTHHSPHTLSSHPSSCPSSRSFLTLFSHTLSSHYSLTLFPHAISSHPFPHPYSLSFFSHLHLLVVGGEGNKRKRERRREG
jgi:hypothetical protein